MGILVGIIGDAGPRAESSSRGHVRGAHEPADGARGAGGARREYHPHGVDVARQPRAFRLAALLVERRRAFARARARGAARGTGERALRRELRRAVAAALARPRLGAQRARLVLGRRHAQRGVDVDARRYARRLPAADAVPAPPPRLRRPPQALRAADPAGARGRAASFTLTLPRLQQAPHRRRGRPRTCLRYR